MNPPRAIEQVSHRCRPILAGMLAAGFLSATGCGSGAKSAGTGARSTASAAIATAPAAAALVLPAADLHGFSTYGTPEIATTPQRWAAISNERDEVESEIKRLTRAGFQEGVGQHYKDAAGNGAMSLALVFDSAQGARGEVTRYLGLDPRYGLHVEGVKVAAIPGSVVVGEGPAGNVLFTTGRCFLLVGDQLGASATQAQVNTVTIAGASALYARVKGLCA
jgi:hypothetical protein